MPFDVITEARLFHLSFFTSVITSFWDFGAAKLCARPTPFGGGTEDVENDRQPHGSWGCCWLNSLSPNRPRPASPKTGLSIIECYATGVKDWVMDEAVTLQLCWTIYPTSRSYHRDS